MDTLVDGSYEALERDGRAGRLTAPELRSAIEEYPATFVSPPPEAYETGVDAYEIEGSNGSAYAIDHDLWTLEEGQSDLTLTLRADLDADGGWHVVIDDLHVL